MASWGCYRQAPRGWMTSLSPWTITPCRVTCGRLAWSRESGGCQVVLLPLLTSLLGHSFRVTLRVRGQSWCRAGCRQLSVAVRAEHCPWDTLSEWFSAPCTSGGHSGSRGPEHWPRSTAVEDRERGSGGGAWAYPRGCPRSRCPCRPALWREARRPWGSAGDAPGSPWRWGAGPSAVGSRRSLPGGWERRRLSGEMREGRSARLCAWPGWEPVESSRAVWKHPNWAFTAHWAPGPWSGKGTRKAWPPPGPYLVPPIM